MYVCVRTCVRACLAGKFRACIWANWLIAD